MKTTAERKAIEQRLQEICDRNGRLTPDLVVADAKRKDSPLHGEFTWDLRKAAKSYWIEQARRLIASVTVIVHTNHSEVRSVAYVRDPSCASGEQGYVSVIRLRTDQEASRLALIAEFSRVGDYLRRARMLAAALELGDEVERLIVGVAQLRSRIEHASPTARM